MPTILLHYGPPTLQRGPSHKRESSPLIQPNNRSVEDVTLKINIRASPVKTKTLTEGILSVWSRVCAAVVIENNGEG